MRFSTSRILASAQHRLPSVFLAVLAVAAAVPGFFAPYDYQTQNRLKPFSPPDTIRLVDEKGSFHLRPCIRVADAPAGSHIYPIRFFVPGVPYSIAGLPASHHLFGVDAPAEIALLGTDSLGRDVFTRILYGARISLFAGIVATVSSVTIGFLIGGLSGYYGSWLDAGLMRMAEVFLAVPWLYLLLFVRAILPLSLQPEAVFLLLMLVAGCAGWGRPAVLVRNLVLSIRDRDYVLAARSFGASDWYILRKHVLPEAQAVVLVQAAIYLPQYITAEVTLSFFGLGVSEPAPSWGNLLGQLRSLYVLRNCWWLFTPALVLILVLLTLHWFFRLHIHRLASTASSAD